MSEERPPILPQYEPPKGPTMAHPKQAAPMNKLIKQMMKLPKMKKVLQRRTRVSKKKYRIV